MKYPELPERIAHYKILSVLGRGGMGIVYLAKDDRLGRQVAIKCLYARHHNDHSIERLRREAKVLAKLNHPNVVHIYDVVENEHGIALVMEYVKGYSLKQYIQEKSLSQNQKFSLLAQILEGLAAAHRENIIHRDLKSDNILIDDSGHVKIGDFGIAKYHGSDTAELSKYNDSAGSLSAMSPEQIRGEKLCLASDVFAFGLLAWRVFHSRHPFKANNDLVRIEKILNEPAPSLRSEELPQGFSDCLDASLRKDAKQRPQSAEILLGLLKPYLPLKNHRVKVPKFESSNSFQKPRFLKSFWLYVVAILCMFLLVFTFGGNARPWLQPDPIYVAVLEPELSVEDGLDYSDIHNTVYFAVQDGVVALENSFLISPSDIEGIDGDIRTLAKSIGADMVITSHLDCKALACNLILKGVMGDKEKESRVSLKAGNELTEIHKLSQYSLVELFPDREGLQALGEVISESNYKEYFRISVLAKESESQRERMLESLDGIQKRSPKFEPLYYLYTKIALDLYEEKRDRKFSDKAEKILMLAEAELPNSSMILQLQAELYSETKRNNLAKDKINELRKLRVNLRELEVLSGLQSESEKNYGKAVEFFKRANEIRPSVRTYRDAAINYWYLGDLDSAILQLRKARKLNPEDIHTGLTLASFLMSAGNLNEAEELFIKFVEASPVSSTYSNIGLLYMLKRDYKKSEEHTKKALKLSPNNITATLNLADVYLLMGNRERAFHLYKKVVEMAGSKQDIDSFSSKAQALMQLGRYKEALKVFSEIKKTAGVSTALYAETIMYSKLEDYQSAIVSLELSLEKGFGKVWYGLSWFDDLCSDKKFGPEYTRLTGHTCNLQ